MADNSSKKNNKRIHWAGDASFSNNRLQVPSGHMMQRSGNLHRVRN
jgi:hypothetical protein